MEEVRKPNNSENKPSSEPFSIYLRLIRLEVYLYMKEKECRSQNVKWSWQL